MPHPSANIFRQQIKSANRGRIQRTRICGSAQRMLNTRRLVSSLACIVRQNLGERKPIPTLLKLENELYEEFMQCAPQLSDTKSGEDEWEWGAYFLMQHHGVPTRILDWSDGTLIALRFAVREKPEPPTTGAFIYVLDPDSLAQHLRKLPERTEIESRWKEYSKSDPYHQYDDDWGRLYLPLDEDDEKDPLLAAPKIPMLADAPHINRRFAAQRSRFMVFGSDPLWISDWA